ncbi:MAG: hypothetical protein M5U14_15375 [Acidimicrobiia bacterium]|nr:hypothetical protein [Acidimicrobiia bacterium]
MPNLLPESIGWMRPAGRLIWFSLVTIVAIVGIFLVMRRPRSGRPVTWAQAVLGATGIFALFFLCYAIVPHEWITFSDSYLKWSSDKFLFETRPVKMSYDKLRDIVTVGIYLVFFGLNLFMWVKWQQRPVATVEEPTAEEPAGTSAFGRPKVRKA